MNAAAIAGVVARMHPHPVPWAMIPWLAFDADPLIRSRARLAAAVLGLGLVANDNGKAWGTR